MEQRIVAFYVALFAAIWLLSLFPRSAISRIAFSWFGPVPREGESWARYQLRWAFYSLDWLGQIVLLLLLLYGTVYLFPTIEQNQIFLMFAAFALPIGAVMALSAALTFFIKAAKGRYWGPNPMYGGDQREE